MPPYIDTVSALFNSYMFKIPGKPQSKTTNNKPKPNLKQT